MLKGLEHLSYEETLGQLGLVSLEKAGGDPINPYQSLQGVSGDGARPFPVVPTDGMRSNGHKLKHKTFHLNTRKIFFPRRWQNPGAAQGGHGFSLSGDIPNPPGHVPVSPGDPALAEGLAWMISRGSFQP
ncbi:hypothetical protein BTVI_100989 [Pitangus sulphuratus]|nr:hypothetical protein BTVI_100989 [Pitangus sulphuratus]